jgi:hypothetical protein
MRNNPFIAHEFFCPILKGNPRGKWAEQMKSMQRRRKNGAPAIIRD